MAKGIIKITVLLAVVSICMLFAIPGYLSAQETDEELIVKRFDIDDYPGVDIYLNFEEDSILASLDLTEEDFNIKENGNPVNDFKVDRISTTTEPIGVVLVIDTSGSMEGEPIEDAKSGAVVFMDEMRPIDEFALVGFSDGVNLYTGFTTNRQKIKNSIDLMAAEGETALWDGIIVGLNQFEERDKIKHRYLVVLTDGTDTVSKLKSEDVISKALENNVTVYSIALMSYDFNPEEIGDITGATRGELMVAARSGELRSLYQEISRKIRNQYRVSYKSIWSDTESIDIGISVSKDDRSGFASINYENPYYAPSPTGVIRETGPWYSSYFDILWVRLAIYLAIFTGIVLFLYLFIMLLIPRRQLLRDRTEIYGYKAKSQKVNLEDEIRRKKGKVGLFDRLSIMVSKAATRRGFIEMFDLRLQRAGMSIRSSEFITLHLISIIIVSIAVQFITGNYFFTFIILVVMILIPFLIINMRTSSRLKKFHEQLPDTLQLISGSLKAGYSFNQSLSMVVDQTKPPISDEFKRVLSEIRMGMSEKESLENMAERIKSEHFDWVVMSVNIQREVGGNLAEVMEIIAGTIRERDAVMNQIKALTAEGRLSAIILIALPFGIGILLSIINRSYIGLLLSNSLGLAMIGIAFVLMVIGIIWIIRIIRVEY